MIGERLLVVGDPTEDLGRLPLDLLLLAADVRDDVVDDVHRGDTRVASSRNGLERGGDALVDGSEGLLESLERDDESGRRAVGVGDDEALVERQRLLLVRDDVDVVRVNGRDDEGNERVTSVVLCVGEDGELGSSEGMLCREVSWSARWPLARADSKLNVPISPATS